MRVSKKMYLVNYEPSLSNKESFSDSYFFVLMRLLQIAIFHGRINTWTRSTDQSHGCNHRHYHAAYGTLFHRLEYGNKKFPKANKAYYHFLVGLFPIQNIEVNFNKRYQQFRPT